MASAPLTSTDHRAAVPIPLRELFPWVLYGFVLALILLYFVTVEQGAAALIPGNYLHELLHDGRHMLNVPCH